MGPMSFSRVLVAAMLVGGVALAQQGLIVEPWHKAPAPPAALVPPLRGLPGSGLPAVSTRAPVSHKTEPIRAPLAEPPRWSPPVVELLVDPWARRQVAGPAARSARPRWVPTSVDRIDIVDPWADDASKAAPRVASRLAGAPPSTIF